MRNKVSHAPIGASSGKTVGNNLRSFSRSRSHLPKPVRLAGREWSRIWKRLCGQNKRLERENRRLREERKRSEEALRHIEENYRVLIETISHGIYEIDLEGTITQANNTFHHLHGYADGELVGTRIYDLLATDALRIYYHRLYKRSLMERPPRGHIITRHKTRDGRIITLKVNWNYKLDDEGEIAGFISTITDITKQAKAEKSLRQNEIKFRNMVRALHDLVIIYNREGESLECYANNEVDLVAPIEKTIGSNIKDLLPAAIAGSTLHCIGNTIDSGKIHFMEYELFIKGEKGSVLSWNGG